MSNLGRDRRINMKTTRIALFVLWAFGNIIHVDGQVSYWNDQFAGGVISGGYSVGTIGSGTGNFNMPLPPGCTIHQAFFFATQVGNAANITVTLNGDPYTFNSSNLLGTTFNSIYGGISGVHGIDITSDVVATSSTYSITIPVQPSTVTDTWSEFYVVVCFLLPGADQVNVEIYLNDQDPQSSIVGTLNTAAPIISSEEVGLAVVGGYAASPPDCESILVNGTLLGSFYGGDPNSADPNYGAMGTMGYLNGTLVGLGGDDPDQAMAGDDVISNIGGLVPTGNTTIDIEFNHCSGASDNHIWLILLAYSSDTCSISADLGPDLSLCEGTNWSFDATQPGATYLWQDGSTDATFTSTSTGEVQVTVTGPGCIAYDTVQVEMWASPVFDLGLDKILCSDSSLVLNATSVPSGIISWEDGSSDILHTVTTPGTYWVSVDNNGCTATDSIHVLPSGLDLFDLPSTYDICLGDTAILDAGSFDATYQWNTGGVATSISVQVAGTYSVLLTDPAGCTAEDSTVMSVVAMPSVELGPDTSLCVGETILLDAETQDATYEWNTGTTASTLAVTQAGMYEVEVSVGPGCLANDSILITFDPVPIIPISNAQVCISDTVVLDAENEGSTYQWSTGDTTRSIIVYDTGGSYSVTVTTPFWCSQSASAQIDLIPFPVVDLGTDVFLCFGDTLLLSAANMGGDASWSTGEIGNSITLTSGASVWVDVDNGFCTTRDSLEVVFGPLPTPLSADTVLACFSVPAHPTLLDAGNDLSTYSWSTGETTRIIEVWDVGSYEVVITTNEGCTRPDSIRVVESCPPELFLPNSFTPNDDDVNDLFGPVGYQSGPMELTIYDRWGKVIWVGKENDARWDGTESGKPLPLGVYVWKLSYGPPPGDLDPGATVERMGHVTLIR